MEVHGTVVHYTAGGAASGSVSWLCSEEARASAHFVVSRKGELTQLVDLGRAAWHAGASEMEYEGETTSNANRFTIGVELANHGLLLEDGGGTLRTPVTRNRYRGPDPVFAELVYDDGHIVVGWWEPYPDAQVEALLDLLKRLRNHGYQIDPIVGHEEIAVPFGRKMDPGAAFPWARLGRLKDRRTRIRVRQPGSA
jgi:N-acetylmuramoyl-L-alanine amidase